MPEASTQPQPGLWGATKEVVSEFFDDDALTHAASLAYYTALSFAPLLMLLLWIASLLGEDTQNRMVAQLHSFIGGPAAGAVDEVVNNAEQQPNAGSIAGIISILFLLFSASGVFGQLQYALNSIWDVQARPGEGIWGWLRKRFLSFGMVLALGFILLVSLVISSVLSGMMGEGGGEAEEAASAVGHVVQLVVSFAVFTVLFALMFKFLPDVKIAWNDVWVGALATAALFTVGKFLIGLYLGRSTDSSYGAAGSLIALLVWVYYSGLIVFFGAEITQVWARRMGHQIEPDEHAVRIEQRTQPVPA